MSGLKTVVMLYGVAFGMVVLLLRRYFARQAVRQVERITGRRFDERLYLFGFKYAGLAIAVIALLGLLGVLPLTQ
jgi:hypothetical protein